MTARWRGFWFRDAPPHLFALLRILFGLLGLLSTLAVADFATFWDPAGLVSGSATSAVSEGGDALGRTVGVALLVALLGSYAAMTVGYRSHLAVSLAFLGSVAQSQWNELPLSAAHEVQRSVLFALIWADCGVVWAVDARRPLRTTKLPDSTDHRQPVWPLRLIQIQVAVIYASSGLWKLAGQQWRHGETLHYVLNNNVFRRFPDGLPVSLEPAAMVATYVTLIWELGFAPMLCFRWTRRVALALGVALHAGMWITLELGQFSAVMLAAYCAFLNADKFSRLVSTPSKTWRMEPMRDEKTVGVR